MMKSRSEVGQVGLIVLLIMVVLLTLGVSIVSRSTEDVIQSRQEEETSRVFDAAEAGIEEALSLDFTSIPSTYSDTLASPITDISVDYTVETVGAFEAQIDRGHAAGVDVSNAAAGNIVRVSWATGQDCAANPASLVIAIIRDQGGNVTVRRQAYNPGCGSIGDNFQDPDGIGVNRYQDITLQAGDVEIRIRPVYNDSLIRLAGVGVYTLPAQFYRIYSEASSEVGGETRAVAATRTRPIVPGIFDYVLFSGSTLQKN